MPNRRTFLWIKYMVAIMCEEQNEVSKLTMATKKDGDSHPSTREDD